MRNLLLIIPILFLLACNTTEKSEIQTGDWLFELIIDKENPKLTIPFNIEVVNSKQLIIINADEKIEVTEIDYKNDSVFIKIPVFGSEFKGKISKQTITGNYYNYNKSKISPIPFVGKYGVKERFKTSGQATTDLTGKWQVSFQSKNGSSPAIGVFNQKGSTITGTFQTEVGDYRYLQGVVDGKVM